MCHLQGSDIILGYPALSALNAIFEIADNETDYFDSSDYEPWDTYLGLDNEFIEVLYLYSPSNQTTSKESELGDHIHPFLNHTTFE